MGKIVMPKNSALLEEIEAVLQIYYEENDWLSNAIYKDRLKNIIGDDQYASSYTKKAQITTYFGFTEWQEPGNSRSLRRITTSGKRFYEAVQHNNADEIINELMNALETVKFGRDNCGSSESNSDVEPPSVFIRASIDLGYLTYKEFAYIIWKLEDVGGNYTDVIEEIKVSRSQNGITLNEDAEKYADAKPIMILIRWGFLYEDESAGTPKRISVRPDVLLKYGHRLKNLKIYNVDMDRKLPQEECKEVVVLDADNKELEEEVCVTSEIIHRKPRTDLIHPLNQIIYGAPGTGKTYSTAEYAIAIIEKREIDNLSKSNDERRILMEKYQTFVNTGQITFTTFHQSYGYEEFIQGIRPDSTGDTISFRKIDGVFKKIADKALRDSENNYVIIIDEINRGNISKVFGELITLIEDDKRCGELNQLSVTLPLGDVFTVPNNLYIIGTMNSADKSISLIDTALRRRFDFIEMAPNEALVEDEVLHKVLSSLNTYLKKELGSTDLLIGHAFFVNKSVEKLKDIMNQNIVPLLYEYFYDDEAKVKKALQCLENTEYEIDSQYKGRIRIQRKC